MALRSVINLELKLLQGCVAPVTNNVNLEFVRYRRTKHWNPKFKFLRRMKVIKVDLPKFNRDSSNLTEEEIRSRLKEQGLLPPRPWMEKQYSISSTGTVFEPYIPPEGDGKISPITTQGAKQSLQHLEKKTKTMMAIRKIRQFEEEFDSPAFCKEATNIYIKMHELMAAKDQDALIKYVTERAYPEVMHNVQNKTLRWKYIKDIELPRIVHARCTEVITRENQFAQVTVRFHTQQSLAIYDRFGRLIHGSEILAKDVLEYVVFEKHIANEYGIWRIHDKIIPDWLPPKEPSLTTYKKIAVVEEPKVDEKTTAVEPKTVPSESGVSAQPS